MGTSASQRSPRTAQWNLVNAAYDSTQVPPTAVLSRIFAAMDDAFRAGLCDPAAATCLTAVLEAAERIRVATDEAGRLALAGELRTQADRAIAEAKTRSRFGDIGLDALVQVVTDGPPSAAASRASLLRAFLAKYLARTVSYLASRDISAHVGGPRFATAASAAHFVRELEQECEARVATLDLDDLSLPADADLDAVRAALAAAVERGVQAFSTGAGDAQ